MTITNDKPSVDTTAYLAHYGVKGMRWGVRKDGKPGSPRGKKKTGADNDVVVPKNSTGKNSLEGIRGKRVDISKLSDKDLRDLVNRIQTEQAYRKLMPDERSRAEKFVAEVQGMTVAAIRKTGQEIVTNVVRDVMMSRTSGAQDKIVKKLSKK